ncbi:MAG: PA14 domain-containing protein, partial [Candidatus Aminicenantales bacterium]
KDKFALRFRGYIRAPRTGVYVFYLGSDDGSRLSVAGKEIIVNDGTHGMAEERAEIALEAGWHPIEVDYFQVDGDMGLTLSWRGPGFPKSPVPAASFGR